MSKATHRLRLHSSFLRSEFSHCESDRNETRETACHTSENHETTMQRTDCGRCRLSMLTCDGREEKMLARARNWLASRADCAIPSVGHLLLCEPQPIMTKPEAIASGLDRHSPLQYAPSAGHLASRRHGSYPETAFEEVGRIGTEKPASGKLQIPAAGSFLFAG